MEWKFTGDHGLAWAVGMTWRAVTTTPRTFHIYTYKHILWISLKTHTHTHKIPVNEQHILYYKYLLYWKIFSTTPSAPFCSVFYCTFIHMFKQFMSFIFFFFYLYASTFCFNANSGLCYWTVKKRHFTARWSCIWPIKLDLIWDQLIYRHDTWLNLQQWPN